MIFSMKEIKMYKLTVQSYLKSKPDLFVIKEIKTTRNNSGLTLKIKLKDTDDFWMTCFTDYNGEYNVYPNSTTFNNLTCTDEFKEFAKYKGNFISSINIEYIKN